ncbi:hypothetical protein CAter10_1059 [Collimonas arenae]|nr:hypothetical protein CAter10_1059 [Collimonas arenae]
MASPRAALEVWASCAVLARARMAGVGMMRSKLAHSDIALPPLFCSCCLAGA